MPKNAPSTPAKGGTREFWKQHSVSPDTTALKKRIAKDELAEKNMLKTADLARKAGLNKASDKAYEFAVDAAKRGHARRDSLRTARKKR